MYVSDCDFIKMVAVALEGTDGLASENDRDLLGGAGGDQVVRKQLAGGQELVITPLVDQDVELGALVGRR